MVSDTDLIKFIGKYNITFSPSNYSMKGKRKWWACSQDDISTESYGRSPREVINNVIKKVEKRKNK